MYDHAIKGSMFAIERLTKSQTDELFSYDKEHGVLFWKARTELTSNQKQLRQWNARYAGKRVGAPDKKGYIMTTLFGKSLAVHRAIYFLENGEIPDGKVIDHMDGNPSNNRIGNLRLVSYKENAKNCKLSKANTSGYGGVYRLRKKWLAKISVSGKTIELGLHSDIEKAVKAVEAAKALYGFTERHGAG